MDYKSRMDELDARIRRRRASLDAAMSARGGAERAQNAAPAPPPERTSSGGHAPAPPRHRLRSGVMRAVVRGNAAAVRDIFGLAARGPRTWGSLWRNFLPDLVIFLTQIAVVILSFVAIVHVGRWVCNGIAQSGDQDATMRKQVEFMVDKTIGYLCMIVPGIISNIFACLEREIQGLTSSSRVALDGLFSGPWRKRVVDAVFLFAAVAGIALLVWLAATVLGLAVGEIRSSGFLRFLAGLPDSILKFATEYWVPLVGVFAFFGIDLGLYIHRYAEMIRNDLFGNGGN